MAPLLSSLLLVARTRLEQNNNGAVAGIILASHLQPTLAGHHHNPHNHCPHDHRPHAHTPHFHEASYTSSLECESSAQCAKKDSDVPQCIDACRFELMEDFSFEHPGPSALARTTGFLNVFLGSSNRRSAFGYHECATACCADVTCTEFLLRSDGSAEGCIIGSEFVFPPGEKREFSRWKKLPSKGVCAVAARPQCHAGDNSGYCNGPTTQSMNYNAESHCEGSYVSDECNPFDQQNGEELCGEVSYCKRGDFQFEVTKDSIKSQCEELAKRFPAKWAPGRNETGSSLGTGWIRPIPCSGGKCAVCPPTSCFTAQFKYQCMYPTKYKSTTKHLCAPIIPIGGRCLGDHNECGFDGYCTLQQKCARRLGIGFPCPGDALLGVNYTSWQESADPSWRSAQEPGCLTEVCDVLNGYVCERECVAEGFLCWEEIAIIVASVILVLIVCCCCWVRAEQKRRSQHRAVHSHAQPASVVQMVPIPGAQVVTSTPMVAATTSQSQPHVSTNFAQPIMAQPLQTHGLAAIPLNSTVIVAQQDPVMAQGHPVVIQAAVQNETLTTHPAYQLPTQHTVLQAMTATPIASAQHNGTPPVYNAVIVS